MKVKMIAAALPDGWAFIVIDEKLYLLRPPYRADDLIASSEKDLEKAVQKYGFHECSGDFNNLSEVIHYLKEKYVEFMKKQVVSLPDKEEFKKLLKYATEETLKKYLKKAEKEFIPGGKTDAAESIALELMGLEKVRKDEYMFNKAREIIQKCQEERNRLKHLIAETIDLKHQYPHVQKKYGKESIVELMKIIVGRKQLMPIGAR